MRRRKVILVCAAILIALLLSYYFHRDAEPVYQGRKLSAWLRDLKVKESDVVNLIDRHDCEFVALYLPNNPDHNRAVEAIQKLGTSSLPYLHKKLRDKSGELSFRNRVALAFGKCFPQWAHYLPYEPEDDLAWNYLFAAYVLGPQAAKLAPDVLAADECVSLKASILRRVGPAAMPHISRLLHSNHEEERTFALSLIASMGSMAPSTIPQVMTFIDECKDKEGQEYYQAAGVLAQITDDPRKTQDVLLRLFLTGDGVVQERIARGMWGWNTNGKAFGPALLKIASQPKVSPELLEGFVLQTKNTAAIALVRVDPQLGTNVVPVFKQAFTSGADGDVEMLVHTLKALEVLGAYAAIVLPEIKAAQTNEEYEVRVAATNAFRIVSAAKTQAAPVKRKVTKGKR